MTMPPFWKSIILVLFKFTINLFWLQYSWKWRSILSISTNVLATITLSSAYANIKISTRLVTDTPRIPLLIKYASKSHIKSANSRGESVYPYNAPIVNFVMSDMCFFVQFFYDLYKFRN